jgi:hypothetical protein
VENLEVWTRRPERERSCRACRAWDDGTPTQDVPDHSCRTPPATPRTTLQNRARAADRVLRDRELSIRATRLAEINRGVAG